MSIYLIFFTIVSVIINFGSAVTIFLSIYIITVIFDY